MKVVTGLQMQEIDKRCSTEYGISNLILMENAGISVADEIEKEFSKTSLIGVLIGTGNNGGDGLVTARSLFFRNFKTVIFLTGPEEKFSELTKLNFNIIKQLNLPVFDISNLENFKKYQNEILKCDILVDAILGTGLKSQLKSPVREIVEYINSLNKKIISIDIPTGLFSDNLEVIPPIIKAYKTITFGLPKIPLILSPGRKYTGELKIVNIGFPPQLLNNPDIKVNLVTENEILPYIPQRPLDAHKGFFGHTLIFAGSEGKAGAAVMAAQAALNSGVGLVTVLCFKNINNIIQSNIKEAMTIPLNLELYNKSISDKEIDNEFEKVLPLLNKVKVIAAGPGITTEYVSQKILEKLLSLKDKVFILDADALNIIAKNKNLIKDNKNKLILTPHIGELSRLVNLPVEEILKNRIKIASDFANEYKSILVEKSSETIIATPEGEIFICNNGCEGMATAGSGDVLTGILAGTIAQNVNQNKDITGSVLFSVYLHSLAGSIACHKKTSYSMLAGDIINNISDAYKSLIKKLLLQNKYK